MESKYILSIEPESSDGPYRGTGSLVNELSEIPGTLSVSRKKQDENTMDLGSIVEVVITSGATVAIASGIADWIRRQRGIKVVIHRQDGSGSLKAEIENLDAKSALIVTETLLRNHNAEAS